MVVIDTGNVYFRLHFCDTVNGQNWRLIILKIEDFSYTVKCKLLAIFRLILINVLLRIRGMYSVCTVCNDKLDVYYRVMNNILLSRMKNNQSSFELIPEEAEENMENLHNASNASSSSEATAAQAAAMAAAHQAAIAARILQAQQNQGGGLAPELALHQQLFNHQQQFLHQKILEEQIARNRDFLLMSEAEREKTMGLIFQQVNKKSAGSSTFKCYFQLCLRVICVFLNFEKL